MLEFLTSPLFKFVLFPLLSTAIGIGVKFATKNDKYSTFKKEDMAVGFDLMLAAILTYVVGITDKAATFLKTDAELTNALKASKMDSAAIQSLHKKVADTMNSLTVSMWFILMMLLGLWILSTVIRKKGWKSDTEMHTMIGIVLPLVVGVLLFIVVMWSIGQ